MARRKQVKKTIKQETAAVDFKRPEFWIGVVTFVVLVGAFTGALLKKQPERKTVVKNETVPSTTMAVISPVKETTPETMKKESSAKKATPKKVTKLANTAGYQVEVVRDGDSYWRIAKRVCGDGRLYWLVEAQNNSKALFAGATVTVDCGY